MSNAEDLIITLQQEIADLESELAEYKRCAVIGGEGRFENGCVRPLTMWCYVDGELEEEMSDPTEHIKDCKMCQNLFVLYGGDLTTLSIESRKENQ